MTTKERIEANRAFCRSDFGTGEPEPSDQKKRLPQPPLCKMPSSTERIRLTRNFGPVISNNDFLSILENRCSVRFYKEESLSQDQLSFLLYACQGVKGLRGDHYATIRTVPSAGARHPFETYLAVRRVKGLQPGVYHYLPLEHALEPVGPLENPEAQITEVCNGQVWAGKCAVAFLFSFVPYRAEWRYSVRAHRVALMDAGHMVENLYLACGAVGCGTCAVGALKEEAAHALCRLDGKEEFILYGAMVGLLDPEKNAAGNAVLYAKTIEESNSIPPKE